MLVVDGGLIGEGEPWQAKAIYYYFLPPGTAPTFIVDVTGHYDEWVRALSVHKTQFFNPEKPKVAEGPASILDWFDVYARRDAYAVGARHAQPFLSTTPLKIGDPMTLVRDVVPRP